MSSNNVPKRAVFYNNVEVVHMPSDTHDVAINITKLPDKAIYMKCDERMEITTQSRKAMDKNGKPLAGAAKNSFVKKCEADAAKG